MKIKKEALRLYAVTDRRWLKTRETLRSSVEELLKAGVTCVQLREKEAGEELLLQEAEELQALCAHYGVPLIINDYPGIAKKVKASGVHVGLSEPALTMCGRPGRRKRPEQTISAAEPSLEAAPRGM